jgi:hypothetical protein
VSKNKQKKELIPPWNMPSDPVKAVFWFMHWLLKVVVRFFWIPIIIMVVYEAYINGNGKVGGFFNGLVVGVVTLFVGLVVWALLYGLLILFNISTTISRTVSEVSRMQQNFTSRGPLYPFADADSEKKVVEGTITDLDEERKKRRQE